MKHLDKKIKAFLKLGKYLREKKIDAKLHKLILKTEDNNRCCVISDHAARDLLAISDRAIILANKKIVAHGTPSELINDSNARNLYFGDAFKIN